MTQPKLITVPREVEGLPLIVSVSGGKDSTALLLAMREAGLTFRAVFADTFWEAPETYSYLDLLRSRLGLTIDVVSKPGGMPAAIEQRAGFPSRMGRWCTRELKIEPLRAYHDEHGGETVSVIGVRAAESVARSKMVELEDEPQGRRSWGGWIWRPLLSWSIADVLRIHSRHGLPVNPLYQRGHNRVGCYPCIFAQKAEIELIADHAPARVAEIDRLEIGQTAERARRNAETPGRYAYNEATFFQARVGVKFMPIKSVVDWSRTSRGGYQLNLLQEPPKGGCMSWGLCDTPAGDPVEGGDT
jgi:3'-phosphoadenosine 5'-phosphosulfate sulfotransferase (PAPS reductase)/FAD synthetase